MRNKIKQVFKKQAKPFLLLLILNGSVATAYATTQPLLAESDVAPVALSVAEQRELFVQTEQHINSRKFTQARQNMAQLQGYALYPYLEAAFLQQNLSLANEALIGDFLAEYSDTPVASRL